MIELKLKHTLCAPAGRLPAGAAGLDRKEMAR